ncbi:hypothetical protein DFS34DRAFT_684131 [Phlyctochytrium arcticum]|nr:hypothetical protein DFS34DRAFT_684131 [Phlyctochytrium arcticum]
MISLTTTTRTPTTTTTTMRMNQLTCTSRAANMSGSGPTDQRSFSTTLSPSTKRRASSSSTELPLEKCRRLSTPALPSRSQQCKIRVFPAKSLSTSTSSHVLPEAAQTPREHHRIEARRKLDLQTSVTPSPAPTPPRSSKATSKASKAKQEAREGPILLLESADLWNQFHTVGNEMIITKNGRCLFPILRFQPVGLNPSTKYSIAIDVVQTVPNRFKYKHGKWVPQPLDDHRQGHSRRMEPVGGLYMHPDSPQSGAQWMKKPVSFAKVKLTNKFEHPAPNFARTTTICSSASSATSTSKRLPSSPPSSVSPPSHSTSRKDHLPSTHFCLASFNQYQPRVHLIRHDGKRETSRTTFLYEQTTFVAVTHYQSLDVNNLKKNFNPHAKGFKDQDTRIAVSRISRSNSFHAVAAATTGTPSEVCSASDGEVPTTVNRQMSLKCEVEEKIPVRTFRAAATRRPVKYRDMDSESDQESDDGPANDYLSEEDDGGMDVDGFSNSPTPSTSTLGNTDARSTSSTSSTPEPHSNNPTSHSQSPCPPSSPLQVLSFCCSQILDSGVDLSTSPTQILLPSLSASSQPRFYDDANDDDFDNDEDDNEEDTSVSELRSLLKSYQRECHVLRQTLQQQQQEPIVGPCQLPPASTLLNSVAGPRAAYQAPPKRRLL